MSIKKMIRPRSASGEGPRTVKPRISPGLRAREPIGRSFGLVRGKFPSRKAGRMIHWESQIERDAVLLFEFSPGVITYREQPISIHYSLDHKTRRYTPDFELSLSTGEVCLIEIKPAEKLIDSGEARRFRRIAEHFASESRPFRILTDQEIRQPVLLHNLRLLMRHRRPPLSPLARRQINERLRTLHAISFDDAVTVLGDAPTVWHLIDEKILFCSLHETVSGSTMLSTTAPGDANEKLYF